MQNLLGENIQHYRKSLGMTQNQLAVQLGVTFQAVSKWETGQTAPETALLPRLAELLRVSIDRLMGYHSPDPVQQSVYDELYSAPEYYWGTQPTALSLKVLSYMPPQNNPKVLDVGSREGQNVLFFARNGYRATGIEMSQAGIEKGKRLAEHWHVEAQFIHSDARECLPTEDYDVIFSDEILHLIRPALRLTMIEQYKVHTSPGGIHVISVPVQKPFLPRLPDQPQRVYPWRSGELFTCYCDWRILECSETEPLLLGGNHSPRIYNTIVAQKP